MINFYILLIQGCLSMKKEKAFTLAEVLITLTIIGVIAAMTIPGLRKNAQMRELAAGCKKAYAGLYQAVDLTQQEIGPVRRWNWNEPDTFLDEIKTHLNIMQDCKTTNCFEESLYYEQSGTAGNWSAANARYMKMADGSRIMFYTCTGNVKGPCGISSYNQDPADTVYASFFYDVNGPQKPNTFGYDIFLFNITKNGILLPAGSYNTKDCKTGSGRGLSCTAKVLQEGAINF